MINRSTAHLAHRRVLQWSERDRMPWVTAVGVAGAIAAVAMATFGLPSIDLHPPLHRLGIMDPLCGGTRAARLTMQGRLGAAWTYNPLGIIATVAAVLSVVRLIIGVGTRHWVDLRISWSPPARRLAFAVLVFAVIALEVRQQGRADLLTKPY